MKISHKQLNTHISEITEEEDIIDRRIRELSEEKTRKQKQKKRLEYKKKRLESRALDISEHGLLRYMERVLKVDLGEMKKDILHPDVLQLIEKLGPNGTYPHPDGFSIVLRNNLIVTINN